MSSLCKVAESRMDEHTFRAVPNGRQGDDGAGTARFADSMAFPVTSSCYPIRSFAISSKRSDGRKSSPMTRLGRKRNSDSFDSSLNRGNALPNSTIEMDLPSESKSFSHGSGGREHPCLNRTSQQWIDINC